MIGALAGVVLYKKGEAIVLLTGGVGYLVYVPKNILEKLHQDDKIQLYIHTHVREDSLSLFGFKNREELKLFELLISVSGIGPKTALLVVDQGVSQVERAVASADVDFFSSIPRLGRKNSQKIIIELKSKLGVFSNLNLKSLDENETQDLFEVLTGFGFTRAEIIKAYKQIPENAKTVEDKIREALKILGSKRL